MRIFVTLPEIFQDDWLKNFFLRGVVQRLHFLHCKKTSPKEDQNGQTPPSNALPLSECHKE